MYKQLNRISMKQLCEQLQTEFGDVVICMISTITLHSSATLPTFSSWNCVVPWLNTMYSWPTVPPATLSDSSKMPTAPPSILQCSGQSTLNRLSLILTIEFNLISPAGHPLLLSGHVKKPKQMKENKDTILGAIIIIGLFITVWCLVKFLPLLFWILTQSFLHNGKTDCYPLWGYSLSSLESLSFGL